MNATVESTDPIYSSLGADPDLAEIVDMFVDEMPDRVAALKNLWDTRNWDDLKRTAHQLKGAAGSYGFNQITPYAATFDTALRELNSHDVEDAEIEQQLQAKIEELISWCNRVRSGAPE